MDSAIVETWREIPGWPYAVSDHGRVQRIDTGRILKPSNTFGYKKLALWRNGVPWSVLVHKLVTLVFIGPRPDGKEVNHLNGDKGDNRIENLEYVSKSENNLHAIRVLGKRLGESHGNAKVNNEVVKVIRHMRGRHSQELLGRLFGISVSQVSRIMSGKSRR